jgi:molybdopterin converting factor small subunit
MTCEVRFFGMIGEKLGVQNVKIDLLNDIIDRNDLKKSFIIKYPVLKNMTFTIAVDGEFCNEIKNMDVKIIALLPPFAGG